MITLKEKIVSQIEATEDELLLIQISILLSEDSTSISTLSKAEKEAIYLGLDDVKNGNTISDEDLQKEWNSWL